MTWQEDYAKEAYHDGKAAARDGGGDNPHPPGCFEFDAWNSGYEIECALGPLQRLTEMLEGA